jgi:hypothetical protein
MMSVENVFNIPVLASNSFVNVDDNGNQVRVFPTKSETITKENKIIISQSFINRVKI